MDKEKIKYVLYARKSTEPDDKQILSVESQIKELTKIAVRDGLEIVESIEECKSAKKPGRICFNQMIKKIDSGKFQGIICWKLDRLARNPVDGGQISWMLQQGTIKHIRTFEQSYYPTDNILMMSLEFGMANQFLRDLSVNTARGLRTKVEKGWLPTTAPVGYLNNPLTLRKKGLKDIIKDPDRFDTVKKLFDLFLTGKYSIKQILKIADDWGFRNVRGVKMTRSTLYRIFTNPFYYGMFEYPIGSGNIYKGAHEPMISINEYDLIWDLLGRNGKPRPHHHFFKYTGLIHCAECNSMITADAKIKRQKNGNIHRYTYYFCTRMKNPNCSQRYTIREEELERQILDILCSIEIPPEFHEWAMNQLKQLRKKEIKDKETIRISQQRSLVEITKQIKELLTMRMNGEITPEEYHTNKVELTKEKLRLEELLKGANDRESHFIDIADQVLTFAEKAKMKFENGSPEEKKNILRTLDSNLSLKDRILNVHMHPPIIMLKQVSSGVNLKSIIFEPLEMYENKGDDGNSGGENIRNLQRQDSNLQPSG